ncbi:MAG TPA: exodeoxyribonuclease VII large subunit [Sphingobacterium sp.]|nr:exodeoxyribonuclease VII large subunit [Sphingobacterium sp.]
MNLRKEIVKAQQFAFFNHFPSFTAASKICLYLGMPEKIQDKKVFTLSKVARSIQKTIAKRYQQTYWVKAEMNKLNHYTHSGHAYPELVEKKNGKIVAEMRSILWRNDYERINKQFMRFLSEPLRDGITLIFEAGISFHPLYGMSLQIIDIDVSYVLGELEKEKKECIQKLKNEKLYDKNKKTPFPLLPKRLAIISVETSKGLSDFYNIIQSNPWKYSFECTLYPALLQGDKSIPSIIKQLAVIAERSEAYDAVAIIRGGGGEVGLSSYNNYQLAKSIAIFPLPVLTGIGHSTNETVSEMVAYKSAITPSELADFLIQHFHAFSLVLEENKEKIDLHMKKRFREEHKHLDALLNSLRWNSRSIFSQEHIRFEKQLISLSHLSKNLLSEHKQRIDLYKKTLKIADPFHILQRGFSIIRKNGEIITNLHSIKEGDILEHQLKDGTLVTNVEKINKHEK